jgi:hypothetical protein
MLSRVEQAQFLHPGIPATSGHRYRGDADYWEITVKAAAAIELVPALTIGAFKGAAEPQLFNRV